MTMNKNALLRIAVLSILTVLMGCATTSPMTSAQKQKILAPYKEAPFVSINLYVKSADGEFITSAAAQQLNRISREIQQSSAFARVDVGIHRWPHTLDIKYGFENNNPIRAFLATTVVFAGTLGLVPVWIDQTHSFSVEILYGPHSAHRFDVKAPITSRFSIYDLFAGTYRHDAAVDQLVVSMIETLDRQGLLPKLKAENSSPLTGGES